MSSSRPSGVGEYSIAAVSKLTGVSCHALRVWERRYGFPVPGRSASGHRRYTRDQVRLLRRVAELLRQGQALAALIADAREGRLDFGDAPATAAEAGLTCQVTELVELLIAGDLKGGEACYQRIAAGLGFDELIAGVITPALVDTGERWFRRECDVYQEHCASEFLRRKVQAMIEEVRRGDGEPRRTILVGTVQGERHSGGLLILNLTLERIGWRVVNLGVDLPVREFQKAVEAWRPEAVGLSFVLSRSINKRFRELAEIRAVPVFVGGRSILNYQGLARRHGLIPLPGPIGQSAALLNAEFEDWSGGAAPS
jgi:MerR family transcriptional regulator, light-induced transcriptional regulator